MEQISEAKQRLDALRPLSAEQMEHLWPMWRKEDALFVYASNAIEGNTMTLGETTVVLENGVTIGGKTIREHIEVTNGANAYALMLDMAKNQRPITRNTVLALHEAVAAGEQFAGAIRENPAYIRGSLHVPPNAMIVRERLDAAFESYANDVKNKHPVVAGAKLHFELLTIHPFADGNGRTSRLVNNLHLISHGYPPVLITPDRDKPKYFEALQASQLSGEPGRGDPTRFVGYMIKMEERAFERYFRALETAHGNGRR